MTSATKAGRCAPTGPDQTGQSGVNEAGARPLIRETLAAMARHLPTDPALGLGVRVGPLQVAIRFESAAMRAALSGAFAVPGGGAADYRLAALSGTASGYTPALVPPERDGDIQVSADADGYALWFGRFTHTLHLLDHAGAAAGYWIGDAADIPSWERAHPFLASFQAMLTFTDWIAVHAAGISQAGSGLLITGPGKAGKTSLSLAAAQAGWGFAGDDYVLVNTAQPETAPLYATARLRTDMARHFPRLRAVAEREMSNDLGDVRHELLLPARAAAGGAGVAIGGAPLAAILLLERGGASAPTFSPVSRTRVLASMVANTTTATPGYDAARMDKLSRLLAAMPPQRFDPGPDLAGALAALSDFLGK